MTDYAKTVDHEEHAQALADAEQSINESACWIAGFSVVLVLGFAYLGYFGNAYVLAMIYIGLAICLWKFKSRIAAVALFLIGLYALYIALNSLLQPDKPTNLLMVLTIIVGAFGASAIRSTHHYHTLLDKYEGTL